MEEPVAKRTRSDSKTTAPVGVQHGPPEDPAPTPDNPDQNLQAQLARAKANKLKAMLNPLVLTKISNELPSRDLLNLRETCKEWNFRFIPELKQKHKPIRLNFSMPLMHKNSVRNFNEVMSTSREIPFGNYELLNCEQTLKSFWSICGHSVTKLDMQWSWVRTYESQSMMKAIYPQLRPQLTHLKLRIEGQTPLYSGHDHYQEMAQLLKIFLAGQAPTLRNLTIWLERDEQGDDQADVIPIDLPRMERLHSLVLTTCPERNYRYDFDIQCNDDTFANSLPELKSLQLNHNMESQGDAARLADADQLGKMWHPGVSELMATLRTKITEVSTLSLLFPAITRLELSLCLGLISSNYEPEAYAGLWSLGPTLTHLRLDELSCCSEDLQLDDFLTGVPRSEIPALKSELDSLISTSDPLTLDLDSLGALARKYKTRPGITDLNRLQKFELDWWDFNEGNNEALTDVGGYCGLALVGPQLRYITIVTGKDHLVSEEWVDFMKKNSLELGQTMEIELRTSD